MCKAGAGTENHLQAVVEPHAHMCYTARDCWVHQEHRAEVCAPGITDACSNHYRFGKALQNGVFADGIRG